VARDVVADEEVGDVVTDHRVTTVTATLASGRHDRQIYSSAQDTDQSPDSEQQKQAAQGWGGESGNAEWADEKAGDAIANAEAKNDPNAAADTDARDPAFTTGPDGEVGADAAEEEDKTKSYDQYLAEQKEKRAALGAGIEIRKPNEGSKQKFPEGKAFSRNPEEEEFMSGAGGKTRKAKDAGPKKEQIVVDGQYYAAADSGDRGE
jgi:plasminogen activator inhibitor 1 RNA-binding protein